jgi:hypothetical protein
MDTKQKIEVMQAYVDGKKIEYKERGTTFPYWTTFSFGEPSWNWGRCEYRIKQEPREFVVAYREDNGKLIGIAESASRLITVSPTDVKLGMIKTMKVREVLE